MKTKTTASKAESAKPARKTRATVAKPADKPKPGRTMAGRTSKRTSGKAASDAKVRQLIKQNRELQAPIKHMEELFDSNRFGRLVLLIVVSAALVLLARPLYT